MNAELIDSRNQDLNVKFDIQDYSERIAQLKDWDFSFIKAKLIATNQAKNECEATEMIEEYKRFIELYIRSGVPMPISVAVDPAWHMHILFTRNYERFCRQVVGCFLHHEPTITEGERAVLGDRYEHITLAFYEEIFGLVSDKWWPRNAQICEPPGCHGCHSSCHASCSVA